MNGSQLMSHVRSEKRYLPRLLCKDAFSACSMAIGGTSYEASPINYHRQGIALYTSAPLPDVKDAKLSLSFRKNAEGIEIVDLPVRFVHVNEMDVGCRYGLAFALDSVNDASLIDRLGRIEDVLSEQANSGDRYGLF